MGFITGFYPSMVFVPLVYNGGDQNVCMLTNHRYACLQVLSEQIKPHNLHYKYNPSGLAAGSA